jgi:hypothetical protein
VIWSGGKTLDFASLATVTLHMHLYLAPLTVSAWRQFYRLRRPPRFHDMRSLYMPFDYPSASPERAAFNRTPDRSNDRSSYIGANVIHNTQGLPTLVGPLSESL